MRSQAILICCFLVSLREWGYDSAFVQLRTLDLTQAHWLLLALYPEDAIRCENKLVQALVSRL